MANSLAIILILGIISNKIFEKMKLPGLLGMLILGMIIGPYGFNLIGNNMIDASADLRKIALLIILIRAGFGIDKNDLKKIGKSALKMSCIPGLVEGFLIAFMSMKFLNFSFSQGGMLGFIIAAVSPAVVVPAMIKLIEEKKGIEKGIPTLILAGASIDDVFAITIFSVFLGLYGGSDINIGLELLSIPKSIIFGIILGVIVGLVMVKIFDIFKIKEEKKSLLLLGISIVLSEVSSLLSVMAMAFIIMDKTPEIGKNLSKKFNSIWVLAEILLFVLVGAEVNTTIAFDAGGVGMVIILVGLIGRSLGVLISLAGTDLNSKERLFSVISYTPKATVQAAMGAVPLSMGVESGELILAIAVMSILITAPLGAIGINISSKKLLNS